MALRAVHYKSRRRVVRIRRRIVKRNMTGVAIRRRTHELSVNMALAARQRCMCARQGERRVRVIERRAGPIHRTMANRAIHREPSRYVIRIGRRVIQRNMARIAIRGCPHKHVICVALCASNSCMRAGQRERCLRVVKRCSRPICRAVANRTIEREICLHVIRIRSSVVLREMARIAILGRVGEVRACVALVALQCRVRARQRERRLRVIEGRARPVHRAVALRAIQRKSRCHVVRIRRRIKERQMARIAIRRRPRKFAAHMALRTLQCRMRARQRERRL